MRLQEIIARKRAGEALSGAEISAFTEALTSGAATDAQIGAFAMAVCIRGMTDEERGALTAAMRDSGEVMKWDLPGPVVDKHSTGGVGDNVSLILAPALAACGAYVPMISGRGLGHTGGTLDKLAAIPGYSIQPGRDALMKAMRGAGCAIIGQSADLAPADRRLYAIRDESGAVESTDLIVASILSKKLAAGLDALILDVKCGSGAFMQNMDEARALARALTGAGNAAGTKTAALITDMDEPLASAAGNALEVANAAALLTGHEVDARLWDVVAALGAGALHLAGLAADEAEGARKMADALESGKAAERFQNMISALGGPDDFLENWRGYMADAPVIRDVPAPRAGFLSAVDGRAIGLAVIALGGGRLRASDEIDTRTGFDQIAGKGAALAAGEPLARVHARTAEEAEAAIAAFTAACEINDKPAPDAPVIRERIAP